jgi:hypothetical protein
MWKMLSKIKKIFIIGIIILCLTGCSNEPTPGSNGSSVIDSQTCGYHYTYTCGFDIMSGSTKCGYGYYYICY